jgi:transposase
MTQSFASYKALEAGCSVEYVDPRHSSQECPRCEHTSRSNRKTTRLFRCVRCRFQHNSWSVAAYNLRCRAGSASLGSSGERYTAFRNPALNQRAFLFAHS